jgi:phosphatidate cytidylyltransferase
LNTQARLGSDFPKRLLTALIGIPVIVAAIFIGYPVWSVVVIGTALVCVRELRRMITPEGKTGLTGMIVVVLACFISFPIQNYLILAAAIVVFFGVPGIQLMSNSAPKRQFLLRNFVYPAIGALYIGMPLVFLLAARGFPQGALWTGMAFATNWSTDGFALIGGRIAGRRKLAPAISPGKTVEGAAIGLVSGFAIGTVCALLAGLPANIVLVAAAAIAVLTILGDLLESLIKRSFSVKDAGYILPGHGGLLDRVDGMLLAGPALYLILLVMLR